MDDRARSLAEVRREQDYPAAAHHVGFPIIYRPTEVNTLKRCVSYYWNGSRPKVSSREYVQKVDVDMLRRWLRDLPPLALSGDDDRVDTEVRLGTVAIGDIQTERKSKLTDVTEEERSILSESTEEQVVSSATVGPFVFRHWNGGPRVTVANRSVVVGTSSSIQSATTYRLRWGSLDLMWEKKKVSQVLKEGVMGTYTVVSMSKNTPDAQFVVTTRRTTGADGLMRKLCAKVEEVVHEDKLRSICLEDFLSLCGIDDTYLSFEVETRLCYYIGSTQSSSGLVQLHHQQTTHVEYDIRKGVNGLYFVNRVLHSSSDSVQCRFLSEIGACLSD